MLGSYGMHSKNNFYDESARVPLIIRYPAKNAAGKRITVPVNLIDVRLTIDDYFNLPATKVDGKSLRPFIEDTYNKNETHFAVSEWYNDKIPGFMVRTDTHKLMIAHTAEAKKYRYRWFVQSENRQFGTNKYPQTIACSFSRNGQSSRVEGVID